MQQRCIDQQKTPALLPGAIVTSGTFLRNLKKDHVSKRYAGDDNEKPLYGFKINTKHWKSADAREGNLSVNLVDCIRSGACSIAIQPEAQEYFHVATVDLASLNKSGLLPSPLVAQYKPVSETENRCHFEFLPTDGTTLQWLLISVALDSPFPPANKLPRTPDDQRKASEEYQKLILSIRIDRWVRSNDGEIKEVSVI